MFLLVHNNILGNINLADVANQFVDRKDSRKHSDIYYKYPNTPSPNNFSTATALRSSPETVTGAVLGKEGILKNSCFEIFQVKFVIKIPNKIPMKKFIFSKVADSRPSTLLRMHFFIGIFEGF